MSGENKDAYGHDTDQHGNRWVLGNKIDKYGNTYNGFGQQTSGLGGPPLVDMFKFQNSVSAPGYAGFGSSSGKYGCFTTIMSGILTMLLLPAAFFSLVTCLVEFIMLSTVPYFLVSGGPLYNFTTQHYSYHPILGLAASIAVIIVFLLINSFVVTGSVYSLIPAFCWMLWAFKSTGNDINPDALLNLILKSPIHGFENLFHVMSQGTSGWAVYTFIGVLLTRIVISIQLSNIRGMIFKKYSVLEEIKALIIVGIPVLLFIGWMLSLRW